MDRDGALSDEDHALITPSLATFSPWVRPIVNYVRVSESREGKDFEVARYG